MLHSELRPWSATAPARSDLLNPASWTKSPTPIFQSSPAANIYAPASNGWFMSPDGRQTWFAFHAVNDKSGNCGWERDVYAQRVTWAANGTPDLGGTPHPIIKPVKVPQAIPAHRSPGLRRRSGFVEELRRG